MAREDGAAFDSKYLLGLKVSNEFLCLLRAVYRSVMHQFVIDFEVQVLIFSVAICFVFSRQLCKILWQHEGRDDV